MRFLKNHALQIAWGSAILLALALAAFGQSAPNPSFNNVGFPVTMTDTMYWQAQPPAVQALQFADPNNPSTTELAIQLASQGYTIDVPIEVWHWSPTLVMVLRTSAGYTWVPSALQAAIQEAPGVTGVSGAIPYNSSSPPAGSITVCTLASCYPPSAPPPPPPAPTASNVIGPLSLGNTYIAGPGAIVGGVVAVQDGKAYIQGGISYTAHVYQTLFGKSVYFTQP